VKKLVTAKRKGKPLPQAEPAPAKTKIINIMDALRSSRAEGRNPGKARKKKTNRKRPPKGYPHCKAALAETKGIRDRHNNSQSAVRHFGTACGAAHIGPLEVPIQPNSAFEDREELDVGSPLRDLCCANEGWQFQRS
jgi:hypothetical protein